MLIEPPRFHNAIATTETNTSVISENTYFSQDIQRVSNCDATPKGALSASNTSLDSLSDSKKKGITGRARHSGAPKISPAKRRKKAPTLTDIEQGLLAACPAAGRTKIVHALALLKRNPNITLDCLAALADAHPSYLMQNPVIAEHYGRRAPLSEEEQTMLLACPAIDSNKNGHARALIKAFPEVELKSLIAMTGAHRSHLLQDPFIAAHYGHRAPPSEEERAMLLACPAKDYNKTTRALALLEKFPLTKLERLIVLTGARKNYLLQSPEIAGHYGRIAPLSQEEKALLAACPAAGLNKSAHAWALLELFPKLTIARLAVLTRSRRDYLLKFPLIAEHYGFSAPLSEQEQAMLKACPAKGRNKKNHARALLELFPNELTLARLAAIIGATKGHLKQDPVIAAYYGYIAPLSEEERALLIACPAKGLNKIAHARALLEKSPNLAIERLALLAGARKNHLREAPMIAAHYDNKETLPSEVRGNVTENTLDVCEERTTPKSPPRKRSLPECGHSETAIPEKVIKEEEDIVTWRTHQMNNDLPILQNWRNPAVSVMALAESDRRKLKVTLWGNVFNALSREAKSKINHEAQWFLNNEGRYGAYMDTMMSVVIPLDDEEGYRGRSVFACKDLPACTVLGPYSGRYLEGEAVLKEYEKEYGLEAGNYYFTTRSKKRSVAAFPEGNILSLINTPEFNQPQSESYQVSERQNVSTVLVGKNINFYVTTRDIRQGEELWFDYGPDYRHFEPHEDLRSAKIKLELSTE